MDAHPKNTPKMETEQENRIKYYPYYPNRTGATELSIELKVAPTAEVKITACNMLVCRSYLMANNDRDIFQPLVLPRPLDIFLEFKLL